jgi:hypothetical protein
MWLVAMELAQRLRARRACAAGIPIVEKPLLGNALVDTIQSVLEHGTER